MIPKILHQTWKTEEVPPKLDAHRAWWFKMSVQWDYRFYTDEDLLREVREITPHYEEFYQRLRFPIERVDFARYLLMYRYGGVYADLDTEPSPLFSELLEQNIIILGTEPTEHAHHIYRRAYLLCNAFLLSPPREPFWLGLVNYIVEHYNPSSGPVANTGPLALTHYYETYSPESSRVQILPPCSLYPIMGKNLPEPVQQINFSDGRKWDYISATCSSHEIYGGHFWANTWVPSLYKKNTSINSNQKGLCDRNREDKNKFLSSNFWWIDIILLIISALLICYLCG